MRRSKRRVRKPLEPFKFKWPLKQPMTPEKRVQAKLRILLKAWP